MDYNIAPLYISSPKVQWCTWCTKNGRPWPLLPTAQTHPLHPCLVCCTPKGWRLLDAPPRWPWWVQQRDAPVADPARLRCDAVSMLRCVDVLLHSQHANESGLTACSQLGSAGVAFAFRRPSLPSSPSPTSIALPALGTPLDPVWLEGSLGAEVQGSDRGIAHHWGPCPADCPVKQRCGPGVQESKPQSPQTTSSLCRPTSNPPPQPSHPHTHTHTRTETTAEKQRTRKWTAWRRARRSWEGSAAYRSMCLSRQNSGITLGSLEPL
jgi:hypothetical protein